MTAFPPTPEPDKGIEITDSHGDTLIDASLTVGSHRYVVLLAKSVSDPEFMGADDLIERIAQRVVQLLKSPTQEPT